MRTPRHLLLPQTGGLVHKFWRAHNRSYLLEKNCVKETYLKNTFYALEHRSIQGQVKLHAFCVMSNHVHECLSYQERSTTLSHFMRIAHGRFGLIFNKQMQREGAVAYDRPKTPLIQPDNFHAMRVHFYIEANPLRAKMTKDLKMYRFSSYRFYAWGVVDEYTAKLTPPAWYLALGKTAKRRQANYRALFDAYLKEFALGAFEFVYCSFIGDPSWTLLNSLSLKHARSEKIKEPPPTS
jgi:putative transposase